MNEKKSNKIVGISGMRLDNSSISNCKIIGKNSEAEKIGIFDSELIDTTLNNINITDENNFDSLKEKLISQNINELDLNELKAILEIDNHNSKDQKFGDKTKNWIEKISLNMGTAISSKIIADYIKDYLFN